MILFFPTGLSLFYLSSILKMLNCWKCQSEIRKDARFCHRCGAPQDERAARAGSVGWVPEISAEEVRKLFSRQFRGFVANFFEKKKVRVYEERLTSSDSYETVWQPQIHAIAEKLSNTPAEARRSFLHRQFDGLIQQFLIRQCKDINQVYLNEAILKYQWQRWTEVDRFAMIWDHLDFTREADTIVYTDFTRMPFDKLQNATNSFLHPRKNEKILLICDQTIRGSCKEGFALTAEGLYWKSPLSKPRSVAFDRLTKLRRQEDWITINDMFFNANRSLNVKLLLLLHNIQRMQ